MNRLLYAVSATALLAVGCGRLAGPFASPQRHDGVRLLTLTAFEPDVPDEGTILRVFVQPADADAGATYRFELYELKPYNTNPRGRRLMLWPEIAAVRRTDSTTHWRPHVGAYEFELPMHTPSDGQRLVLEVTALLEDGTRQSDMLTLTMYTKSR